MISNLEAIALFLHLFAHHAKGLDQRVWFGQFGAKNVKAKTGRKEKWITF
jgi:hypothetical protein